MALLLGATEARRDGVTTSTHSAADRQFANWVKFLHSCELGHDVFLDGYSSHARNQLLGAFAHAVRVKAFSKRATKHAHLVASTCQTAVGHVCQAFVAAGRPNPSLDANGKTSFLLQRQYKGYRNNDPACKHQKAIPLCLIHQMIQRNLSDPGLQTFHELTLLAFFFAMRSCEYLKVTGDRRTHPLRLRNLVFRRRNAIVPHDDPNLHLADTITVTFEYQKTELRDDSITQSKSGHILLCPVRAGAAIVRRLLAIKSTRDDFLYRYKAADGTIMEMTGNLAVEHLRDFIKTVPTDFGLPAKDVGLHSLRSSAAMAMYLNKIPVYTLMLLGRWSSDAFLRYIRKQVTEFSNNVSKAMIMMRAYHHVPDPSREDPRTHNSMAATANTGMGANGATINRAAFAVWV
jgi:hypothetical protein